MKVAITDYSFPDVSIEEAILCSAGHEVVAWKEKRSAAELIHLVADADAVITQFAPVNAEVVSSLQKARAIVRYGIGVDNVDLEQARLRNIPVCNVPDYCIDEVADHTLAFLLATTRQVVPNCIQLRTGKWGLATPLSRMAALRDLTVGIVGFGRIGREVAARLLPFKCRVLVFDPVVKPDEIIQAGCLPASFLELLASVDIITLHCPSNAHTRNLLNHESLGKMKSGAIIINLARGDLIDTNALVEALKSGHLGGAALDVFNPEPLPADHPLLKMENVIVASHIASASVPAVQKLRETAARLAARALSGEPLPNIVNGVIPAFSHTL